MKAPYIAELLTITIIWGGSTLLAKLSNDPKIYPWALVAAAGLTALLILKRAPHIQVK